MYLISKLATQRKYIQVQCLTSNLLTYQSTESYTCKTLFLLILSSALEYQVIGGMGINGGGGGGWKRVHMEDEQLSHLLSSTIPLFRQVSIVLVSFLPASSCILICYLNFSTGRSEFKKTKLI